MKMKLQMIPAIAYLAVAVAVTSGQVLAAEIVSIRLTPNSAKTKEGREVRVTLTATIKARWHINSNKPNEEFLIPSVVSAKAKGITLADVKYPEALELSLPFAEQPVSVYEKEADFELVFSVGKMTRVGKHNVHVVLDYQACDDKTCLPPTSVSTKLVLEVVAAPPDKRSGESSLTPEKQSRK
jgi:DsbC/DsbD-like thiol-disulfide interchange protein